MATSPKRLTDGGRTPNSFAPKAKRVGDQSRVVVRRTTKVVESNPYLRREMLSRPKKG